MEFCTHYSYQIGTKPIKQNHQTTVNIDTRIMQTAKNCIHEVFHKKIVVYL